MTITVKKTYGSVELSGEYGSAAEGLAHLDEEARTVGLLNVGAAVPAPAGGAEPEKRRRGRPSKAETEAAAVVEAARLQPPPTAPIPQFPVAAAPDPNPGNAVDPAWFNQQQGALPPFPGAMQAPPVAPPPGVPMPAPIAPPLPADIPNQADPQTAGWANYAETQIESFRSSFPQHADMVLLDVLKSNLNMAPPDFKTAREWLHKLPSPALSAIVRNIGERITAIAGQR